MCWRLLLVKQDFDLCPRVAAHTIAFKTGRDDSCIVDNEHVARSEKLRQVADAAIFEPYLRFRMDDEHTGRIARHDGAQRNAVEGQMEIEEIDAHTTSPEGLFKSHASRRLVRGS